MNADGKYIKSMFSISAFICTAMNLTAEITKNTKGFFSISAFICASQAGTRSDFRRPFGTKAFAVGNPTLKLKRWAIIKHPSGMKMKCDRADWKPGLLRLDLGF